MNDRPNSTIIRLSVLTPIALIVTGALVALRNIGAIHTSWWVITAPLWSIPVLLIIGVLIAVILMLPETISIVRSERRRRREIARKQAEMGGPWFLHRKG